MESIDLAIRAAHGDPNFVLSLARGLLVLEAFHDNTSGLTVSDLAARTGLSRAAVRRLLMTLSMLGYVERSSANIYKTSSRLLRLGFSYLSASSLPALATPILEQVTAAIHESASLSILDGNEIVYIARSSMHRVMAVGLAVGSRLPAYCTSMGRVLLASLPPKELHARLQTIAPRKLTPKTITSKRALLKEIEKVRRDGFCMVNQELEPGLRSLAVPVLSRTGKIVAAMNTGVHAARITRAEMLDRFLPLLKERANHLGNMIG